MRNTYKVNRQASIARILFAGFFKFFLPFLHAQIKEYNTKISTTPNKYDKSQHKSNASPTAPQ